MSSTITALCCCTLSCSVRMRERSALTWGSTSPPRAALRLPALAWMLSSSAACSSFVAAISLHSQRLRNLALFYSAPACILYTRIATDTMEPRKCQIIQKHNVARPTVRDTASTNNN